MNVVIRFAKAQEYRSVDAVVAYFRSESRQDFRKIKAEALYTCGCQDPRFVKSSHAAKGRPFTQATESLGDFRYIVLQRWGRRHWASDHRVGRRPSARLPFITHDLLPLLFVFRFADQPILSEFLQLAQPFVKVVIGHFRVYPGVNPDGDVCGK